MNILAFKENPHQIYIAKRFFVTNSSLFIPGLVWIILWYSKNNDGTTDSGNDKALLGAKPLPEPITCMNPIDSKTTES